MKIIMFIKVRQRKEIVCVPLLYTIIASVYKLECFFTIYNVKCKDNIIPVNEYEFVTESFLGNNS
jgi:hypothetical protein